MKAIIPAAGLGTRFLPGTKCTPKEMLPVLDKPVIQYVVEEALDPEEVDDAIIVTSPGKPELLNYFQPDRSLENLLRERGKDAYADAVAHAGGMPVDFRYQYEPKGLGHAIRSAADAVAMCRKAVVTASRTERYTDKQYTTMTRTRLRWASLSNAKWLERNGCHHHRLLLAVNDMTCYGLCL